MNLHTNRRRLLTVGALAGAGFGLRGLYSVAQTSAKKDKPSDVNATEDLMREHGVLRRVLLVYEEAVRQMQVQTSKPPPAEVFASATRIVQRFVENYHEKLEEEQVFPRLEKARKLVDLTRVLREQHSAGRKVTAAILQNATASALQKKSQQQQLVSAVQQFIRMYRPHAAWEDTELFPVFHSLFTEEEFDKLGDLFEEKEHQALGKAGFEGTLEEVGQLEKTLGIHDLSFFTPK